MEGGGLPVGNGWAEQRLEKWAKETRKTKAGLSSGLDATRQRPGEKPTTSEDVIRYFDALAIKLGYKPGEDRALVMNVGDGTDDLTLYSLMIATVDFLHHLLRLALGKNKMTVREYVIARNALFSSGLPASGFSKFPELNEDLLQRLRQENEEYKVAIDILWDSVSELEKAGLADEADHLRRAIPLLIGETSAPKSTASEGSSTSAVVTDKSYMAQLEIELPDAELKSIMMKTIDEFQRFLALCVEGESHMEHAEQLAKDWFKIVKGFEKGYAIFDIVRRKSDETPEQYKIRFKELCQKLIADMSKAIGRFHGFNRFSFHPAGIGELMPIGFVPKEGEEIVTLDSDGTAKTILDVSDYSEQLVTQARDAQGINQAQ